MGRASPGEKKNLRQIMDVRKKGLNVLATANRNKPSGQRTEGGSSLRGEVKDEHQKGRMELGRNEGREPQKCGKKRSLTGG